jgi:hypothetical protein
VRRLPRDATRHAARSPSAGVREQVA